jgi:hypothetical protein
MGQIIRCINCEDIFFKTPYDQSPEYDIYSIQAPSSFQTSERDDFRDFLKDHLGHRLEELTLVEDTFVSEKEYMEPVKVSYWRATNGKERFVIKRFRKKIGDALTYQLIAGDYFLKCASVEIQSREIAKQLAIAFKPKPLSEAKVSAFIKLLQRMVRILDIHQLERVPEESPKPLEVYYKMDDVSVMFLLRNCRHIFEGKEYPLIEAFIHDQKDDGVLLLKATYAIQIIEKTREAAVTSIPLEMKNI